MFRTCPAQAVEDGAVPLRARRVNRSGKRESCRVARRRRVLALVFRELGLDTLLACVIRAPTSAIRLECQFEYSGLLFPHLGQLAEERVLHSRHDHLCRTRVGKLLRADVTERRRGGREAGAQRRPGSDSGAAVVARSGGGRGSRDTGGEGPGRCARSGGGGVAAAAAARWRDWRRGNGPQRTTKANPPGLRAIHTDAGIANLLQACMSSSWPTCGSRLPI